MIALNFSTSVYTRKIQAFTREEDYQRRKSSTTLLRHGSGEQRDVVERNTGGREEGEEEDAARGRASAGCNRVSGVGDYGGTSNIKRPGTKRRSTTPDYPRCTALSREIDTRDAF